MVESIRLITNTTFAITNATNTNLDTNTECVFKSLSLMQVNRFDFV